MLKLLLVDDEEIICNSIVNLIDWEAIGIQVVGICLDGVEAYHTILDEAPDIVMTDIRMPGISGLELIERISRTNLNISFIILSGYGDFEYAKAALQFGVRDYLLKPCDEFQIMDCLKKVMEVHKKLLFQSSTRLLENPYSQQLQKTLVYNIIRDGISLPLLENSFFDTYNNHLDLYDIPFRLFTFYYLEKKNLDEHLMVLNEYFSSTNPGLIVYKIYILNVLIIFFPDYQTDYNQLYDFLNNLSVPTQSISCTCDIKAYPNLFSLFNALIPRLKRFDILYFIENDRIVLNYNFKYATMQMSKLIEQLSNEDSNLTDIISDLKNILDSVTDKDFMIQLISNLLISLNTKLSENPISVIMEQLLKIRQMNSFEEIISTTLDSVSSLMEKHLDHNSYSIFIEKLINFTIEHLSDQNLTLKWISENYLYMNVNYVSRRFFQETNQKYSNFLMTLRVQKAKELLSENRTLKIQDIAELVGCGNNPNYLSRIFKKCTGITPSAYINSLN